MSRLSALKMIKRRARTAGLPAEICAHSFRGTGIPLTESIHISVRFCPLPDSTLQRSEMMELACGEAFGVDGQHAEPPRGGGLSWGGALVGCGSAAHRAAFTRGGSCLHWGCAGVGGK